jgi:hypothetical protein
MINARFVIGGTLARMRRQANRQCRKRSPAQRDRRRAEEI